MLKSKSTFFKHSKVVYFGVFFSLVTILNVLLSNALHMRIHNVGEQLVKQVYELKLDPNLHYDVTAALVNSKNFMLKPTSGDKYFQHIIKTEREVFNYKTLSMNLYHWPAWVMQSYLFILLNVVLLGAAAWGFRWWNTIFTNGDTGVALFRNILKKKIPAYLNTPVFSDHDPAYSALTLNHNLFIIASSEGCFGALAHANNPIKEQINAYFSSLSAVSIKQLKNGDLAITLANIPISKLDEFIERLHERLYVSCNQQHAPLIKNKIKIGACSYHTGADQISVYLLARSALMKAKSELNKYSHRFPINRNQIGALSNLKIIDYIKKNQFIILFQPLFDLISGDILQHEALIRIKNNPEGLITARSFIGKIDSADDALLVDQAVLLQVKKILLKESESLKVSINLHSINLSNQNFWQWVEMQFSDAIFSNKLQFEVSESYFMNHKNELQKRISDAKVKHIRIVVDNVTSLESITALAQCTYVCGIKLNYNLIHLININDESKHYVRDIIKLSHSLSLPVYAVGVETQQELATLTELGVNAAQGFYFSEPLQEFNQAVFH